MLCLCSCLPLHPVHICKSIIHFQIFHHLKRCKRAIWRFEPSVYDLVAIRYINNSKIKTHNLYPLPALKFYRPAHLPYLAFPFLPLFLHSPLICLKYPSSLKEYALFCRKTHFPCFNAVVSR